MKGIIYKSGEKTTKLKGEQNYGKQNTKQITKKLGVDERYNACPHCGNEVYLYVDEDGEYYDTYLLLSVRMNCGKQILIVQVPKIQWKEN